jgi:hypothetical protein
MQVAGLTIDRTLIAHPLLGDAQAIAKDGVVLTYVSALDWNHPTEIPTIAEPGALPPGTGGAIMNLIAERTTSALRYAGPYPTPALYRTLLRSFRASADEATFTRDVLSRTASVARDPIAVDFTPAPHRRIPHAHGISEVRDGLERTTIDNISYEVNGSPARLVDSHSASLRDAARSSEAGPCNAAEVWFGDAVWSRVAALSPDGALLDGPHPIAAPTTNALGRAFPLPLRAALGELITDYVPEPLAEGARELVETTDIVWADLGARAARRAGERLEVHAAIWERIAPHGLARVALAIAEALAPVVTTTLVVRLARASRPSP